MVRDDRRREKEVGYGAAVGSKSKEKIMVTRTRMDNIESYTAISSVAPKRRKISTSRRCRKQDLVFNSN